MATIIAKGGITITDINDAVLYQIYVSNNLSPTQIKSSANTFIPDWNTTNITFTPHLFVSGVTGDQFNTAGYVTNVIWADATNTALDDDGADHTWNSKLVYNINANKELTIKSNHLLSADNSSELFHITGDYIDPATGNLVPFDITITLHLVLAGTNGTDGGTGVTGILTNDSATIGTDYDGTGGDYDSAVTTMKVYIGSVDDSSSWSYTETHSAGVVGSLTSNTYTVTNLTTDTGYVDIKATKIGYDDVIKRFSISKSKQGANAVTYWFTSEATVFTYTPDLVNYMPESTVVKAYKAIGDVVTPYDGWYQLFHADVPQATTAWGHGTTVTLTYTDLWTAGNTCVVKMYKNQADAEANNGMGQDPVDIQTFELVSNGIDGNDGQPGLDGQDGITLLLTTPDGDTFYNDQINSVDIVALMNRGGTDISGQATFQWAKLVSGNYVDITGATTKTLTVTKADVLDYQVFRLTAVYQSDVLVVYQSIKDKSDPIQVQFVTPKGTVLRNAVTSVTASAFPWRKGVNLDPNGTVYTYLWTFRSKEGTSIPTPGGVTGAGTQTITVAKAAVDVNLIAEITISD